MKHIIISLIINHKISDPKKRQPDNSPSMASVNGYRYHNQRAEKPIVSPEQLVLSPQCVESITSRYLQKYGTFGALAFLKSQRDSQILLGNIAHIPLLMGHIRIMTSYSMNISSTVISVH